MNLTNFQTKYVILRPGAQLWSKKWGGTKFSYPRGCISQCLAPAWNGWPHHEAVVTLHSVVLYGEFRRPRFLPLLSVQTSLKVYGEGVTAIFLPYNAWKVGGTVPRTRKSGRYAYSESYAYDVNGCNSFFPQYFQLLIHWLLMILHAVFCLQITCLLMIFIVN